MIKKIVSIGCLLFLATTVYIHGQSDVLISKGTDALLVKDSSLWVFDGKNQSNSRVDLFSDPPLIYNTQRELEGFSAVTPVGDVLFGYYPHFDNSGNYVDVFSQIRGDEEKELFKIDFRRSFDLAEGVVFTSLISTDSLVIVGFGNVGIAVIPIGSSNGLSVPKFTDTLAFHTLTGRDTTYQHIRCGKEADSCSLQPLEDIYNNIIDSLVSVDVLALDETSRDSQYLFIGSRDSSDGRGLRRGLLGSGYYPKVTSMGLDTASINKIFINPFNGLIWVFTDNNVYISDDGGIEFRQPGKPADIPSRLFSHLQTPSMAFFGDTSMVNFDFSSHPGLVFFVDDRMLVNSDEEDYAYMLEERLNGLLPTDVLLGELAVVSNGHKTMLVVGTKSQGLYYLNLDGEGQWSNINRQTIVSKGLNKVITFPTIFDGTSDVGIGYQIAKNADVTIKVMNYAMEKVRTIVKNRPRKGGGARSENPQQDIWDGKDDNGNAVSTGLYYILITSDNGERGWGKVMVVYGR